MKFCSTIAALLVAASLFVPSDAAPPKLGICPKVFNTLVAVPPCENDEQCSGDEKCCKFDYGSVCAPPISIPPEELKKPGQCPKDFQSFAPSKPCGFDRDCPGDDKCCVFDYGSVCAPPVSTSLGCPTPGDFGICIEGCEEGCKNGQICCSNGCGHQCMTPVPVSPIDLIKPGQCPKSFKSVAPSKPCRFDRDCAGDDKCCTFDHGSVCAPPVSTTFECPTPIGFGTCDERCFIGGCKDGQICCSNGCGHQCMTPVPVKPGFCGRRLPFLNPLCRGRCRHDGDCPGKKKCCPNKCGKTCEDPFFLQHFK